MNATIVAWPSVLRRTLIASVLVAACATTTNAQAQTSIRYSSWNSAELQQVDAQVIARFEELHPDVKIEYLNIPGWPNYFRKLNLMVASGDIPDVISHFNGALEAWHSAGFLADLNPILDDDPDGNAIRDALVGAQLFTTQGRLEALPRTATSMMLYYNRDLFEGAGVAVPNESWTFDDVLDAARALTKTDSAGNVTQWGIMVYAEYDYLLRWLPVPFGGFSFSADNTTCGFDQPGTLAALKFYNTLFQENLAPPFAEQQGIGDQLTWQSGNIGMVFHIQAGIGQFISGSQFRWDIEHVPTGPLGQRVTRGAGAGIGVSASTEFPEAAWEFAKFMAYGEGASIMASQGLGVAKRDILSQNADAMADSTSIHISPGSFNEHSREVYVDSLNYADALPTPANVAEIESALTPYWDELRLSTRPVEAIAADMQAACARLL